MRARERRDKKRALTSAPYEIYSMKIISHLLYRHKKKNERTMSMSWANRIMGIGMLLVFLGGSAADSPGDGTFYAAGIVLIGCGFMFIGQLIERVKDHETR